MIESVERNQHKSITMASDANTKYGKTKENALFRDFFFYFD